MAKIDKGLSKTEFIEKVLVPEVEHPYEVPDNWCWVYIGSVFEVTSSKRVMKDEWKSEGIPFYRTRELVILSKQGFVENELYISNEMYEKYKKLYGVPQSNDLLISGVGTIGIPYVVEDNSKFYFKDGNVIWFQNKSGVNAKYIYYLYNSTFMYNQIHEMSAGTTVDTYTIINAKKTKIPLPPLAEQKRIVEQIDSLFNKLDEARDLLSDYIDNYQVQKDILLQKALTGKLVKQKLEDGTADELYKIIMEEKEKRYKIGILKREKPFPEIYESEIPFEIPKSWKWVRVGEIFNLQAGKNISAEEISDSVTIDNKYPCFGGNGVRGFVKNFNREGNFPIIGRQGALCGNINFASGQFYATEHAVVVDGYGKVNITWAVYFLIALRLNQYATATAQPGLAVSNINNVLLPLPPLAEQERIVSLLDNIYNNMDKAYDKIKVNLNIDLIKKSILAKAFRGELSTNDLSETSSIELLKNIITI